MIMKEKAAALLKHWRKDQYIFGNGVIETLGEHAATYGTHALVVGDYSQIPAVCDAVVASLRKAGVTPVTGHVVEGAKPNAPKEDVYRIETYILHHKPDFVVAIGGGSTIDACKAASILSILGKAASPDINDYFGTNLVTDALNKHSLSLIPVIAVAASASSASHLTKYSNVSDPVIGQKKLIVDEAIVPVFALFDYAVTASMPRQVTLDGILDALSHVFEVFFSAKKDVYDLLQQIVQAAFELVIANAETVLAHPDDLEAREALGMATDLGGYAIMLGSTSGAHLTSFSLVDVVAHGTACGIMNPYYMVFYAPRIQPQLQVVANILHKYGLMTEEEYRSKGSLLGIAVAQGMMRFSRSLGAPVTLNELQGFQDHHVSRILTAAKDPQLKMKLQNMPVPMTAQDVDKYMKPLIQAAITGDLSLIVPKC